LKIPARRLKQRYGSMDIPYRSSWTGAHASFQAREYDAGASLTSREPMWKRETTGRPPTPIFKFSLEVDVLNINEII
jgi:hypothetical protein